MFMPAKITNAPVPMATSWGIVPPLISMNIPAVRITAPRGGRHPADDETASQSRPADGVLVA